MPKQPRTAAPTTRRRSDLALSLSSGPRPIRTGATVVRPAGNTTRPAARGGPGRWMREDGPVRLRLDLGYDGTDFSGWATQPGRRTVEGVLSDALTTLLRSPDPVRLTVA